VFELAQVSTTVVGLRFDVTIIALDDYGHVATGYTGTVHFASTDPAAALPDDYSFSADDAGSHTFGGVTLTTTDKQAILVVDIDSGIAGSITLLVVPG
jgi:hypothetical protein